MLSKESATVPIRIYPRTHKTLKELAAKNDMTIAKVVETLSRFDGIKY